MGEGGGKEHNYFNKQKEGWRISSRSYNIRTATNPNIIYLRNSFFQMIKYFINGIGSLLMFMVTKYSWVASIYDIIIQHPITHDAQSLNQGAI